MFSSIRDWPLLLSQSMGTLEPGGWLETIEMDVTPVSDDGTLPQPSLLAEYFTVLTRAAADQGVDIAVAPKMRGYLERAGFVNVVEKTLKLPLGTWAIDKRLKNTGLFNREQFLEGIEGIIGGYLREAAGWDECRLAEFLEKVKDEVRNKDIHSYWVV